MSVSIIAPLDPDGNVRTSSHGDYRMVDYTDTALAHQASFSQDFPIGVAVKSPVPLSVDVHSSVPLAVSGHVVIDPSPAVDTNLTNVAMSAIISLYGGTSVYPIFVAPSPSTTFGTNLSSVSAGAVSDLSTASTSHPISVVNASGTSISDVSAQAVQSLSVFSATHPITVVGGGGGGGSVPLDSDGRLLLGNVGASDDSHPAAVLTSVPNLGIRANAAVQLESLGSIYLAKNAWNHYPVGYPGSPWSVSETFPTAGLSAIIATLAVDYLTTGIYPGLDLARVYLQAVDASGSDIVWTEASNPSVLNSNPSVSSLVKYLRKDIPESASYSHSTYGLIERFSRSVSLYVPVSEFPSAISIRFTGDFFLYHQGPNEHTSSGHLSITLTPIPV